MTAIDTNSYGSLEGVGSLVPKWAGDEGDFSGSTATRPTDDNVVRWIDQISGLLNSILAEAGFTIPIDNEQVRFQCAFFVEQEVAAIVEGVNGFGRFGPQAKSGGKRGRFALLVEDVEEFVNGNKTGFQRLGAARSQDEAESIGYRSTDESGDDIAPIFQREAFGNAFTDWDT